MCEHLNTEYIPEEYDVNARANTICLDCGENLEVERFEE